MEMRSYLDNLFADSSEANSTIQNRIGFLMSIARKVPSSKDLTFLRKEKIVLDRVQDSPHVGTQYGRMIHIIKAIDMVEPSPVSKKTRDRYIALIKKLKPQKEFHNDNNIMTPKQEERHLSMFQLRAVVNKAKQELLQRFGIAKINNETVNALRQSGHILTFGRELQDVMIMVVYVLQPALRNNWGSLKIVASERIAQKDNSINYLIINRRSKSMSLLMNDYKNKWSMKQQKIEIFKPASNLLFEWLIVLQACLGHSPEYPFYYSFNMREARYNENKEAIRKQIQRVFKRFTDKDIGINDMRHIWEKHIQEGEEYKHLTIAERSELHRHLLHGFDIAQRYNLIRRAPQDAVLD